MADSQLAVEHIIKLFEEKDVDRDLTPKQRAESRALRALIEDKFYWGLAMDRWVFNKAEYVMDYFPPIPGMARWMQKRLYKRFIPMVNDSSSNSCYMNHDLYFLD